MIKYGFEAYLEKDIESSMDFVISKLKEEGFGIVSTVDMSEKFKDKLGIIFKKYFILGACSPQDAYDSVRAEENIGLLLPCNVILFEKDGGTSVSIIKPTVAMSSVENEELNKIAPAIESRLERVIENIRLYKEQ
ncbi:MAG: DUF302 domain-containing protein [Spirochaetaceae bacterium]